jgi:hypothetical protein
VRRAWITIAVLAGAVSSAAQPAAEGVVIDRDTATPIAGATVIGEHAGTVISDDAGRFTLVVAGDRVVVVNAPGYRTRTVAVSALRAPVELEPVPAETIEVHGRAPEQTKPVSYSLSSDEVRELPGAGNDVLRAAQALPGVSRIPYSFGGLVLRGTSPRDTAVYLDGVEVPIAFHFGGITSFYPSSMLAELAVTSGGFDASYGRAEGGIVTLTTREPRVDRWRVGGAIGLLDSGVWAEGPVRDGGLLVGVRRSYLDTVVRPVVADDVPLPSYWDAQIRGAFGDPGRAGRITPMLFLSIDRVSNDTSGQPGQPEKVTLTSMFVRAAAPYLRQWGPMALRIVPWLGINRLSFANVHDGREESFARPEYPGGLRAELSRDYPWGYVRGGLDSEGGYLSHTQIGLSGDGEGPRQADGTATLSWFDTAGWAEARVKIEGERMAIKPGVRVEHYGLTDEWVVDPRLNIHEQLDDTWTLRQAIGRFHQPPTPADVDPQNGNTHLKASYVDQASLGVDARISATTALSLTGFYDDGRTIPVVEQAPDGQRVEPDLGGLGPTFELLLEKQLGFTFWRGNDGRLRSKGIELLVKYSAGRWFGMVAYTLSKSDRTDHPLTVPGGWRPFELDQRHNLNLAGSVAFARWRFGARVQLVSGNPYSPWTCMEGDFGNCRMHPWAGRLPMFFQLDVRADRRWHRCWGDVDLYVDIQNATDYGNVEGRELDGTIPPFGGERDIPGLPIVPFIGVEITPSPR